MDSTPLTDTAALIDMRLQGKGSSLAKAITEMQAQGLGWRAIAEELAARTDRRYVSPESARKWAIALGVYTPGEREKAAS